MRLAHGVGHFEGEDKMVRVWTNGCFDVLHRGHIEMFKYARSLGTRLIVGVDSDRRVRENKGPGRPFNNVNDRMAVLKAIRWIDEVVIFDTDDSLRDHLRRHEIDSMIVGSDWRKKYVIGSEIVRMVYFFDRMEEYSTTKILEGLK